HVGAGVRLGPALGPYLLRGGDLRQEARLLLGRAELHDRRAEQEDAVLVDALRGARAVVLLLEDQPLEEVGAAAAVLARPGHHRPAAGVQRPLPRAVRLEPLARIEGGERRARHVRLEPRPRLRPKCPLRLRVREVHGPHDKRYAPSRKPRASGGRSRNRQLRPAPRWIQVDDASEPGVGSKTTSSAPSGIWSPSAHRKRSTTPSAGAVTVCSIFIASSTRSGVPRATSAPASTSRETTRPGIGA